MKPFALVCFDFSKVSEANVRYELDLMTGIENYFTVFPGVFLIKKSISSRKISERFKEMPSYRQFLVVDFDSDDAAGIVPRTVAEEIKRMRKSKLY